MKAEFTDKGYKETTVKHYNVEMFSKKPFMTVEKWIESNKRLRLDKKRKSCNCCKTMWGKIKGNVNLVFTDKGNKMVCDNCYTELKKHE